MSIFSIFSNAWNSFSGSGLDTVVLACNIDGSPMVNDSVDIHGNPFGVVDMHSQIDPGVSFDAGAGWSSGSGFHDFS